MDQTTLSLLTGLISGTITAVVTYFATYAKARLDLTVAYSKELHEARLTQYKDLWKQLKPLARYSLERPTTPSIVKATSEGMRDWYFDRGGIYLSRASRGPYFDLKAAMQEIIDDPQLLANADAPLDRRRLASLQKHGSVLREALSNDIGSRRGPFV